MPNFGILKTQPANESQYVLLRTQMWMVWARVDRTNTIVDGAFKSNDGGQTLTPMHNRPDSYVQSLRRVHVRQLLEDHRCLDLTNSRQVFSNRCTQERCATVS
jgi:hypothetical protein